MHCCRQLCGLQLPPPELVELADDDETDVLDALEDTADELEVEPAVVDVTVVSPPAPGPLEPPPAPPLPNESVSIGVAQLHKRALGSTSASA